MFLPCLFFIHLFLEGLFLFDFVWEHRPGNGEFKRMSRSNDNFSFVTFYKVTKDVYKHRCSSWGEMAKEVKVLAGHLCGSQRTTSSSVHAFCRS